MNTSVLVDVEISVYMHKTLSHPEKEQTQLGNSSLIHGESRKSSSLTGSLTEDTQKILPLQMNLNSEK